MWKKWGDIEGDELSLSINSLASDFADFEIYLDYANVEMGIQDDTSWKVGIDYIRRFDDLGVELLRPFLGAGIGYLETSQGTPDGRRSNMVDSWWY